MADLSDAFFAASSPEIAEGYALDEAGEGFACLVCGHRAEKGRVYRIDEDYFEAQKYIQEHVKVEHGSVLGFLLSLDKRLTGITVQQRDLIARFARGQGDKDIAAALGIAASTVRNHRFALRERARQAKVFLAAMSLMAEGMAAGEEFVTVRRSATMVDERYAITESEKVAILAKYFSGTKLREFPIKQKRKLIVLGRIAEAFERGRRYAEKEVNEIIMAFFDDYATIRRYLVEYGFMDREPGGSAYWLKD